MISLKLLGTEQIHLSKIMAIMTVGAVWALMLTDKHQRNQNCQLHRFFPSVGGTDTYSPGRLEWMLSNNLLISVLFCGTRRPESLPNPELCLLVYKTHPFERDPVFFASSILESILVFMTNPSSLGLDLSSVYWSIELTLTVKVPGTLPLCKGVSVQLCLKFVGIIVTQKPLSNILLGLTV